MLDDAGDAIIFDMDVVSKANNSPVTAVAAPHGRFTLTPVISVLSEEGSSSLGEVRRALTRYTDPLDGTKNFDKRN